MSCELCEDAQIPEPDNEITGLKQATYLRVGRANVLVSGCDEHLKELMDFYIKGLKAKN